MFVSLSNLKRSSNSVSNKIATLRFDQALKSHYRLRNAFSAFMGLDNARDSDGRHLSPGSVVGLDSELSCFDFTRHTETRKKSIILQVLKSLCKAVFSEEVRALTYLPFDSIWLDVLVLCVHLYFVQIASTCRMAPP